MRNWRIPAYLILSGRFYCPGQGDGEEGQRKRLDFVKKLQQYTGPVMAKGLEDTAFYIYNRLLS